MKKYDYCSVGKCGHTCLIWGNNGCLSGYETSVNPRVIERLNEGALLLVKTSVSNDNLTREVVNGPMLDSNLDSWASDKCPEIPDYMIAGLGGSFKTLAKAQKYSESFSGLDKVGLGIYLTRWLAIGAKLYQIKNNEAVPVSLEETQFPHLVHIQCAFWGKVSVWLLNNKYQVRWGGNGWDPTIKGEFDTEEEAIKLASKLSWDAYDNDESKEYFKKETQPKLNRL